MDHVYRWHQGLQDRSGLRDHSLRCLSLMQDLICGGYTIIWWYEMSPVTGVMTKKQEYTVKCIKVNAYSLFVVNIYGCNIDFEGTAFNFRDRNRNKVEPGDHNGHAIKPTKVRIIKIDSLNAVEVIFLLYWAGRWNVTRVRLLTFRTRDSRSYTGVRPYDRSQSSWCGLKKK